MLVSILPDSRLKDSNKGSVIGEWIDAFGNKIKIEFVQIYCFSCGKKQGLVPMDAISYVSWLCHPCSIKYGKEASLHNCPDSIFWEHVKEEMINRFGRELTQEEILIETQNYNLGRNLELLEKESPYRNMIN